MLGKVSIVTAYQSLYAMTTEMLDCLVKRKGEAEQEIILVNAGCWIHIEHAGVSQRIDLHQNISYAHSMNTGIKASTGDYVVVMNNDAFPEIDGWLDKLIRWHKRTDAMVISPEVSRPMLEGIPKEDIIIEHERYAEVYKYPAVCWMLPRTTIDRIGLFDEQFAPTMFEDDDYARRVQDKGGKFIVVKNCPVTHLRSAENDNNYGPALAAIYYKNEQRFKEKWGL